MAYLNFSALQGQPVPATSVLLAPLRAQATFSALEWQVIAIARKDRLSSLRRPGRISALLELLFGGARANPRLADPKLEALRRAAVLAWRGSRTIPPREVRAFHDAGFSPAQYEALLTSVGRTEPNKG